MRRMRNVLVVMAIIVGMIAAYAPNAYAWDYTRTKRFTQKSALWPHPVWYWLQETGNWNVKSAAQCGSLYPCFGDISWSQSYGEGLYDFVSYGTPILDGGTLSNGVKWKSRQISAQFEGCIVQGGLNICKHQSAYVKIIIRTDGSSSVSAGVL